MTLHPDNLLGRDLTFSCAADPGVLKFRVTVVAYDPARGWKLAGKGLTSVWVTGGMLEMLLSSGVLEPYATFAYDQPDYEGGSFPVYTVHGGPSDLSSVTAETLKELGIEVPK
jgi:hypothetical protein